MERGISYFYEIDSIHLKRHRIEFMNIFDVQRQYSARRTTRRHQQVRRIYMVSFGCVLKKKMYYVKMGSVKYQYSQGFRQKQSHISQ